MLNEVFVKKVTSLLDDLAYVIRDKFQECIPENHSLEIVAKNGKVKATLYNSGKLAGGLPSIAFIVEDGTIKMISSITNDSFNLAKEVLDISSSLDNFNITVRMDAITEKVE